MKYTKYMKRAALVAMVLMVVMLVVPAAFAQGAEAQKAPANPDHVGSVGGRLAGVAIAAFVVCGLGQGRIVARRPAKASRGIRELRMACAGAMILALVFVETLTLFTFALGFLLYRLL